jgi:hypothetical protein
MALFMRKHAVVNELEKSFVQSDTTLLLTSEVFLGIIQVRNPIDDFFYIFVSLFVR